MSGVLGKYRLDHRLGGGGMAEVFIAQTVGAEGFSRKVAIKRVLAGFSDNPAFARMFVDEAQISARLVHPNIVSVLDFDRDAEGRLFLVMELVDGRDLDSLVSTGLLPIPVVIFVITEVLRGLGYAHDLPIGSGIRGVVHRDVSPHNVLLSWEGALKVSDFGIAKARSASEATASEFIKGKPAYMSPEQANGERLDGRSDLFAVGIMLWEMLCGRRLFIGEDTRTTLAAVLFGQIPRPRSLRGDVPKDLERVTMKLLERDLPARYKTAEAAITDLIACTDAPKNGREALATLLAERFPAEAPVRHSVHRSKGGGAPHPRDIANADTIAAGTPDAAIPSLGAFRNAQTSTIHERPRRKLGVAAKAIIVVVVAGGSAAATFAVVRMIRGDAPATTPTNAPGSGSGSDRIASTQPDAAPTMGAPPAVAAPIAPPDAEVAIPADAPTPPPDAAKNDATPVRPVEKTFGLLSVEAWPILTVEIDGKLLRDSPITGHKLPVGKHRMRLTNSAGYDEKLGFEIRENKTTTIRRM